MTTLPRFLRIGASALALTSALLLSSGCHRKSQPAPFTAQLTELEDAQAVYTLRHPKLISADLDKLMNAVPEAALARMFLGGLASYGYPEFSDIEAGSNIGVVMLKLDPAKLGSEEPELIAFAKLKDGGKIATALADAGLALQKHGAWTWIAQNASTFAKIKNADALTAYIARPQTEDLRAWGRVSPALLAEAKTRLLPKLQAKLSSRPAPEQKALLAYFDVAWGYLAQLHSLGSSLALGDQGITLAYSAQFTPDSPTGTLLRYAPGPAPKIAQSIPADSLLTGGFRQNMDGQLAYVKGLFDALVAVDYPAGSELLKTAETSYLTLAEHSDSGAVMTMNMTLPALEKPPVIDMLAVQSGHYTPEQLVAYYKNNQALSAKAARFATAAIAALSPKFSVPLPSIQQQLTENALTIDGISFGSLTTASHVKMAGHEQSTNNTQYFGVVNGNMVVATDEAALRAKLPAIIAGQAVPDAVALPFKDDEIALFSLHGEKIVEMVATTVHIDLSDPDIQAQVKTLRQGFAEAGPIQAVVSASQAQGVVTISIPYKFISQSVRLGQFASANAPKPRAPAGALPAASAGAVE